MLKFSPYLLKKKMMLIKYRVISSLVLIKSFYIFYFTKFVEIKLKDIGLKVMIFFIEV